MQQQDPTTNACVIFPCLFPTFSKKQVRTKVNEFLATVIQNLQQYIQRNHSQFSVKKGEDTLHAKLLINILLMSNAQTYVFINIYILMYVLSFCFQEDAKHQDATWSKFKDSLTS